MNSNIRKTKKRDIPTIILFLLPAGLVYTAFMIIPLIQTCYFSMTSWNGVADRIFIGISNFVSLVNDRNFWTSFWNTMQLVVISLIFQIVSGLLISYLLYRKTRGFKIFRTIYFLPVVIAPVAIGLMFSLFYNSQIGVFNKLLAAIGLGAFQTNWLSNVKTLLYAVMAPQIWQYIGLYTTIFLGALQSVPEDIIESAQMDGAGEFVLFTRIIIPEIRNFVFIAMILCITGSLKSFDHSWIMTKGGPGVRSAYLGVYMYKTSFVNSDFGTGSAISVVIIVMSMLFSMLLNWIQSRASD